MVRLRASQDAFGREMYDYLLVSVKEMRRIVEGTGWQVARVFESGASSYVAVLEKAKG